MSSAHCQWENQRRFSPPHDHWEDSTFERSQGRRWDLQGVDKCFKFIWKSRLPDSQWHVDEDRNRNVLWTCAIFNWISCRFILFDVPDVNNFIFLFVSHVWKCHSLILSRQWDAWVGMYKWLDSFGSFPFIHFHYCCCGCSLHPSYKPACVNTWHHCQITMIIYVSQPSATVCCVILFYLLRKRPENVQEQPCRQGNEKEAAITSESASSDSSAVLLLFHPHAVSFRPSVFIQWSAAPACHAMKTAQKWLLWKRPPPLTGHLCHLNHSNAASCWVTLPEHLRLFWRESLELCFSPLFLSNHSRFDNWCREPFHMQRNRIVDFKTK